MSLCYNNTVRYEYQYTSDGKLHSVTDIASGVGYLYEYDSEDRLSGYVEYKLNDQTNTLSIKYIYNNKNQLDYTHTCQDYILGTDKKTVTWGSSYYYDDDSDGEDSFDTGHNTGLLKKLILESNITTGTYHPSVTTIHYEYDDLLRLDEKIFTISGSNTFTNTVDYTYNDIGNALSSQVKTYSTQIGSNTATKYTYTYDSNGNITQIVDLANNVTQYHYDDLGQLVREDNPYLNKSYVFTYDNNGNRTSRKIYAYSIGALGEATTTTTYTHGDSTWGDRLTKYNTASLTFDEIGNPLYYYNGYN